MNFFVDYDTSTVVAWNSLIKRTRSVARFHLPFSTPMSVGNILTNLLDLKAIPTKQFLSNYSTIVDDKDKVKEIEMYVNDPAHYKEWVKSEAPLSIVDVIERFPPKADCFDRLLEIL